MRTIATVLGAAVIAAAASGAVIWAVSSSDAEPVAPLTAPTATPSPLPLVLYEGTVEEQTWQAIRELSSHGYSVILNDLRDGSVPELWTMAPQELIDSAFGSIDIDFTVVRTDVTAQPLVRD